MWQTLQTGENIWPHTPWYQPPYFKLLQPELSPHLRQTNRARSGRPITQSTGRWLNLRSLAIRLWHEQLNSHTKTCQTTKKRQRLLWNRRPGKYLQPLQESKNNGSSQDHRNWINCIQTSQSQKQEIGSQQKPRVFLQGTTTHLLTSLCRATKRRGNNKTISKTTTTTKTVKDPNSMATKTRSF